MKLNEAIKTVITSTPRPGESLRHRLVENMNSVDRAVGLFQEFDSNEAEKFFAELGNYYSHGSEDEGDNSDFSKISDLLGEITTIIQNRKGN